MALIEVFEKKEFTQLLDGDTWLMARQNVLTGEPEEWREVSVPCCWEQYVDDRQTVGPFWFRRTFFAPETPHGARWQLEFDGVNYYSEIFVNGNKVGLHEGGWSGFEFDIHDYIAEFGDNELLVKVAKQGVCGADFSTDACTAGCLPELGVTFGGIWKSVRLTPVYAARIVNVHIKPEAENEKVAFAIELAGDLIRDVQLDITVSSPHGDVRFTKSRDVRGRDVISDAVPIDNCIMWDTDNPHLYLAAIRLFVSGKLVDKYEQRFGMRSFKAAGGKILLNGRAIHLRGILHRGWNGEKIAPSLTRDEVREELEILRRQGFNIVKHNQYIPNKNYYEIADEMGILIWQKMPLRMCCMTDEIAQRVFSQYEGIYREIRNHPSIVLWTLGDDFENSGSTTFAERLYNHAKLYTNNALVRNDSAGAERCSCSCNDNEFTDFRDCRFNADAHYYADLLAGFTGNLQAAQPLLFGELCDCETTRNIEQYLALHNGNTPWWLSEDECFNPTRRSSQNKSVIQQRLMRELNLPYTTAQIYENGVKSAHEHRKLILEQLRTNQNVNGYVLASIRHTPHSTSAILDDDGSPKYRDEDMRSINDDIVLFLDWNKFCATTHGSDRVLRKDVWNYSSGDVFKADVVASNNSRKNLDATLAWQLEYENGKIIRSGVGRNVKIQPSENCELQKLEIHMPQVDKPQRVLLKCSIPKGEQFVRNSWWFTVYPRVNDSDFASVQVFDPKEQLAGIGKIPRMNTLPTIEQLRRADVLVATFITPDIIKWVESGGKLIYIQNGEGAYDVIRKPFWRQSVQIFRAHPVMDAFPHAQHTGTAFYSMATDCVFDARQLPRAAVRIMDRLDSRTFDLDSYVFELSAGSGKIIATTLRFGGGQGSQASSIEYNPAAKYWLAEMVKCL